MPPHQSKQLIRHRLARPVGRRTVDASVLPADSGRIGYRLPCRPGERDGCRRDDRRLDEAGPRRHHDRPIGGCLCSSKHRTHQCEVRKDYNPVRPNRRPEPLLHGLGKHLREGAVPRRKVGEARCDKGRLLVRNPGLARNADAIKPRHGLAIKQAPHLLNRPRL